MVHEVPSDEVRMVPLEPTATRVLFEWVIPHKFSEVPELLEVHEIPSNEVRIVPSLPTTKKVLFE